MKSVGPVDRRWQRWVVFEEVEVKGDRFLAGIESFTKKKQEMEWFRLGKEGDEVLSVTRVAFKVSITTGEED